MGIPCHKYCLPLVVRIKVAQLPFPILSFPSSILTTIHSDRIIGFDFHVLFTGSGSRREKRNARVQCDNITTGNLSQIEVHKN